MESTKESIHVKISSEIAKNIITGQYSNCSLPTEMELSSHYSVSRNSVREALKILASKGLLCSKQKAGTKVTPRSEWNFLDPQLYEWFSELPEMEGVIAKFIRMQKLLIPEACADAALNATGEQRVQLSRVFQAFSTHIRESENDLLSSKPLLSSFYRTLFIASNNELFSPYAKILDILFHSKDYQLSQPTITTLEIYQKIYDSIMIADEMSARKAARKLFN
ncbi:FadR/GntR family transcriptional regulator [Vibrio maritimus]|uniref:FadR/GntR family transcriptional regulator n=1 Tax=Vibrio maritimus TaxID=990268 RepID=UPI003735809F